MAARSGPPRPDVADMYAVHGVFRDTLRAAPRVVGDIAPDDAARAETIANYYDSILCFLGAHHDGEEVIVFPRLRARCPGETALLDSLEFQHEEAVKLMAVAREAVDGRPAAEGDGHMPPRSRRVDGLR